MEKIKTQSEVKKTENMRKNQTQTNEIEIKEETVKEDEKFLPESFRPEFQSKLDYLKRCGKWYELIEFLKPLADKYSEEYYIMSELSNVYYVVRNAEEALRYAQLAYEIESHDIIVLYSLGCALLLNDRCEEALDFFNRILRKRVRDVAYGPHGEGLKWAQSFHIDAFYLKACCIMEMDDDKEVLRLINLHLRRRKRGVYSDFTKRQVLRRKSIIEKRLKSAKRD